MTVLQDMKSPFLAILLISYSSFLSEYSKAPKRRSRESGNPLCFLYSHFVFVLCFSFPGSCLPAGIVAGLGTHTREACAERVFRQRRIRLRRTVLCLTHILENDFTHSPPIRTHLLSPGAA